MDVEKKICLVELRKKLVRVTVTDEEYVDNKDIIEAVLDDVFYGIDTLAKKIYTTIKSTNPKTGKEEQFLVELILDMLKTFLRDKIELRCVPID